MIVDQMLDPDLFAEIPAHARHAEAHGYGGLMMPETKHDPFVALATAVGATSTIDLGTSIAIGFGRTPMTLAMAANDLQHLSGGRFTLGIGSQIKPHITQRYSMPWSRPAARMRELVLAIRAIWESWENQTRLDFRGEFYTHTLMTPVFTPEHHGFGAAPILVAAVGELMTETAGEVGDGLITHGFTTRQYLDEVTFPALARGAARSNRSVSELTLSGNALVALGETHEEIATAVAATRQHIAFYGSTPAYRGVLELHGWGETQTHLNALSKQGQWEEMGRLITDEMLAELAVVGTPTQVAAGLEQRFGDRFDRVLLTTAANPRPEVMSDLVREVSTTSRTAGGVLA